MSIWLRRAYDAPSRNDGHRVLVDRIWPRGVTKVELKLDEWIRDIAPSTALRNWFDHDPQKWVAFQQRYGKELQGKDPRIIQALVDRARRGRVTLVYGAHDTEHNQAVALRNFLLKQIGSARPRRKSNVRRAQAGSR